jgi:hypothetical protein
MNIEEVREAVAAKKSRLWLLVPIISIGGTALGQLLNIFIIGTVGCVLGAFILGIVAYLKPRRDIVALLSPMYAIIIFFGLENSPNLWTQVLFAVSITILAIRLEKRFSE